MAKHDRVTVRLVDGSYLRLVARKAGGSVETSDDERVRGDDPVDDKVVRLAERSQNGEPVREMTIARPFVQAVIRDRDGDETIDELDEVTRGRGRKR